MDAVGPDSDPIVSVVKVVIDSLKARATDPEATLTTAELVEIIGPRSHALAIFVFSLLNLLPAPPGYNFVMALIIIAFSVMMLINHQMRLTGYFGRMKLPIKLIVKLLGILEWLTNLIAKVSAPRLSFLTAPFMRPLIGIIGIVLGVGMLIPIPLTNMLPSIGLAMICVGFLNHDGLGVIIGTVVGAIGLVVTAVAVWIIVALVFVVEDVIDGEPPTTSAAELGPPD